MPNPQLVQAQYARGLMTAVPPGTSVGSLVATIDRYDLAFVAKVNGSAGPSEYCVVSRNAVGSGQTVTVNVTWTGTNVNGAPLTPFVAPYDLLGPNQPPLATSVTKQSETIASDTPPVSDQGQTVTFI